MTEPSNTSQRQWHYAQFGQQHGPVSTETLRDLLAARQVSGEDLVWAEGMTDWIPARSVPELAGAGDWQQQQQQSSPPSQPPPPAYVPPSSLPPAQAPYPQGTAMPPGTNYPHPAAPYGVPAQGDQSGKATTSMWLGISSIVMGFCCPLVGIGLGIAALVVGNKVNDPVLLGKAKTGRICGIIGIVVSILGAIGGIVFNLSNMGGRGGNVGF